MEKNGFKREKKLWYYPLRGAVCFFALFLIKSLTTPRIASFVPDEIALPSQLFYGIALIGILFIYNSLIHTAALYDREEFKRFKARGIDRVSFGREIIEIISSVDFLLETLTSFALSVIFSLLGGFYEVTFTVFPADGAPIWAYRFLPTAAMPLLLIIISLLCRFEIRRYFAELIRKGGERRIESKTKFVLKLILIFLMYPLVFPYSPYLLFIIINFISILAALINLLTLLGFIAAVVSAICLVIGIMRLKAYRMRRAFTKRLTALATEKGASLKLYTKEEREVRGCDLSLMLNKKSFDIRIITVANKLTPLYFTVRDAYYLYRIGTKEHHTSLERHFEYSFPSDGKKLLVLIKFPKKLFASEYGTVRKLYSGDEIWNYIIYDEPSFLGAMERDCLHRSNADGN